MNNVYSPVMYYSAGQIVTIVLDTEATPDGYAIDPINPIVAGVFKPDFTSMDGFPQDMTRLGNETGTFIARFRLPSGVETIGTYLIVVKWVDPQTRYTRHRTYSVVVGAPFGTNSIAGA
jgi:hypothetical protein